MVAFTADDTPARGPRRGTASSAKNVPFFIRFSAVKERLHTRRKRIVTFNQREKLRANTYDDLLRARNIIRRCNVARDFTALSGILF